MWKNALLQCLEDQNYNTKTKKLNLLSLLSLNPKKNRHFLEDDV